MKRWWPVVVIVLVLVLVGAGAAVYVDWTWKRKLSPRGGRPFLTRVELPVPSFQQGDDKWRDDPLGGVPENGTLGGEGCAVAAAAMVFKFYGIDVDPQQLNWFLTATGGFTEQGWLYWDRAAWFAPDRVRHVYEDLPSYQLIDSNIAHGNPVIVRVRLASGITHFVVIAGKDGFDYLVRDPGAGSAKGLLSVARTRQRYRGAAILPADRESKSRECRLTDEDRSGVSFKFLLNLGRPNGSGVLACAIPDFDPVVFAQSFPFCLIGWDLECAAVVEHSHFHDPLFVL